MNPDPATCTITSLFLCGFTAQRTVPYIGPGSLVISNPIIRHWGKTSYTDRKGTRCDQCVAADRLDHPAA